MARGATEAGSDILITIADLTAAIDEKEAAQFLSSEEMARAARLRFPEHRRRFLRAHIALRQTLSSRTGIPAASLQFCPDANGKPGLAGSPTIHFNLSHSGDLAAIATCSAAPVGIDCEVLRPLPHAASLAKRFFAAEEQDALAGLSGNALLTMFFRIWTAKEALLKGIGLGLRLPLRSFAVVPEEDESMKLARIDKEAAALQDWHVYEVAIPGHAAKVAVATRCPEAELYLKLSNSPKNELTN